MSALRELLDDASFDDAPAVFGAIRPPFRFVASDKTETPCWDLAEVVKAAREFSGERYVKVEVFRHHYRVWAQDGRSIGTVRFRGTVDPVAATCGWEPA